MRHICCFAVSSLLIAGAIMLAASMMPAPAQAQVTDARTLLLICQGRNADPEIDLANCSAYLRGYLDRVMLQRVRTGEPMEFCPAQANISAQTAATALTRLAFREPAALEESAPVFLSLALQRAFPCDIPTRETVSGDPGTSPAVTSGQATPQTAGLSPANISDRAVEAEPLTAGQTAEAPASEAQEIQSRIDSILERSAYTPPQTAERGLVAGPAGDGTLAGGNSAAVRSAVPGSVTPAAPYGPVGSRTQ